MTGELDRAVGDEVRAEVARQKLARTKVGAMAGVGPKSWSHYFVNNERDIPLRALDAVCRVLDVETSEMIARAERRLGQRD